MFAVLQRRVTSSPSVTGRAGLSRITLCPDGQNNVLIQTWWPPRSCWDERSNLLMTVMLMKSLYSPAADSHQYSPLSELYRTSKKHQDLSVAFRLKVSLSAYLCVFLSSVHPEESPCLSQVRLRDSYRKNWDLLGRSFRTPARQSDRNHLLYLHPGPPSCLEYRFRWKRESRKLMCSRWRSAGWSQPSLESFLPSCLVSDEQSAKNTPEKHTKSRETGENNWYLSSLSQ